MANSTQEQYKLTRNLWAEALETLPEDDRKLISTPSSSLKTNGVSTNAHKPVLSALHEVETLKTRCQDKRWSFLYRGKKVVVRDVLDQITHWIKKFEEVADWIVSLDVSGHASMPWSCVKFFIEVSRLHPYCPYDVADSYIRLPAKISRNMVRC
jgi:hypothetical protein